jgi:hypothetical protein
MTPAGRARIVVVVASVALLVAAPSARHTIRRRSA